MKVFGNEFLKMCFRFWPYVEYELVTPWFFTCMFECES